MKMMAFFIFTFTLIMCGVTCNQLQKEHTRLKRWDNNGGMNNNGDMSNMFRGTAGVDYPNYKMIPSTGFRCDDQLYEGGLYADVEAQCQVYHICHEGRKDSFLCGQGTIFNQEILACDYWYSTDCEKAPSFYYVNSQIGNSGSGKPQPGPHQYDNQNNPQPGAHQYDNPNNPQPGAHQYDNPNNPQPGANQYDNPNNFRQVNYRGNNAGNVPQTDGINNRPISEPSRNGGSNNNPNANKEDCCCEKYSYKRPWAFPAS